MAVEKFTISCYMAKGETSSHNKEMKSNQNKKDNKCNEKEKDVPEERFAAAIAKSSTEGEKSG